MLKFPKEIGRTYLNLHEVSERLGITKNDVLEELAKEALIYLKCRAIPKSEFNNNDYEIDSIKWIEGLFGLPVDAYVELKFLLDKEITSISFYELSPQSMINLTDNIPFLDGTQLCHAACEDWLYVKNPDVADYVLKNLDEVYFWEDTVQEFAEKNGLIPRITPPHFLPLDVIAKEIVNDANNKKKSPQELGKKPIYTKPNFKELDKINKRKADIQSMARVIAAHFWEQDTSNTIRIGEMSDKVYRFVSDYVKVGEMPENTEAVADWIREVAPEYATKGGRSKVIK